MPKAEEGSTVRVHYTGRLDDGSVFDTSDGGDPLEFTIGSGDVIPGFENGVMGMELNEKRTLRIEPVSAYGERHEELVFGIPVGDVPEGMDPQVGQQYKISDGSGNSFVATVAGVSVDTVSFDANHPLAGKALTFDIELVEIRA
ncbi:MAG: peptidylprolyl isomerase [Spirochaetes bacterium]|nr:peptidylprolyl isomerase [Spirochaetota bacterium]